MDPTAFLALAERCAPGHDPKPLAAVVRRASGYQPLSLQFDGGPGGPMKLLPSVRPEAIELATELVLAGHRVRIGLAGLDTRDLDRLGVSIGDGFDPCENVRTASRLLVEAPGRLSRPAGLDRPSPAAKAGGTEPFKIRAREPTGPEPPAARPWDVYGQARWGAALVYRPPD